jgi:hypothetical protein
VRSAWWTFAFDDWHRGAVYYVPKRTERWSHLEFRHHFERSCCPTQMTVLSRGNASHQQLSVGSVNIDTFANTDPPLRLRQSEVWPLRIGGFPSWSSDNELSKRRDLELHHGSRSLCRGTNLQNPTSHPTQTRNLLVHIAASLVPKCLSTTARAIRNATLPRLYSSRHTDHGICV